MEVTTLTWPEYLEKANDLKRNQGVKPAEIKNRLGKPTWNGEDWHIQSDGKGGISRRKLSTRKASAKRSAIRRGGSLKKINKHLTDEQLTESKAKKRVINEEGLEADHSTEVHETGNMIDDLEQDLQDGKITQEQFDEYEKKIRSKPIGDDPENIAPLTQKDNTQKTQDIARVQKRLKQLEEENPGLRDDHERWKSLFQTGQNVHLIKNSIKLIQLGVKYGPKVADAATKAYFAWSMLR